MRNYLSIYGLTNRWFVVLVVNMLASQWVFADPLDLHWEDGFQPPGTGPSSEVNCVVVDGYGVVYAGGTFTTAGGVAANYVAKWDGTRWSPLDSGLNGIVNCLMLDWYGGLYAGGAFTTAGGVAANHIARWDGTMWHPLGAGVNGTVNAMATDGYFGHLYAAGSFTQAGGIPANGIAECHGLGVTWLALGAGAANTKALAVGLDGSLFCASASPSGYGGVDKWNGVNWTSILFSEYGAVKALVVDRQGNLYAGGRFTIDSSTRYLARWDGSSWSPVTQLTGSLDCLAIDIYGYIYAGGELMPFGSQAFYHVYRWNGIAWSVLDPEPHRMSDPVKSLAVSIAGGPLYAGGKFATIGSVRANYVAKLEGENWRVLGGGTDSAVFSLVPSGSRGFYASGMFRHIGGIFANCVAHWDGLAWSALDGTWYQVNDIATSSTGVLYAAGLINNGGNLTRLTAAWNGTEWLALGSGLLAAPATLGCDGGGNLYAGGDWLLSVGSTRHYIARWDGAAWSPLGTGVSGRVKDIAVVGNGDVYAGGYFLSAGGLTVNGVAKWDGASWSSLGTGVGGYVYALAADDHGNLYAGGSFTTAGGVPASNIAKWDGSHWAPLGAGSSVAVQTLAVDVNGEVYAGGHYTTTDGSVANWIAKWDGEAWNSLGSGLSDWGPSSILPLSNGTVAVGGGFVTAGARPSVGIAIWQAPSASPVNGHAETSIGTIPIAAAPNPFNPATAIQFEISEAGHVWLEIFDVRGRLVRSLLGVDLTSGHHVVEWDGRDEHGARVASGGYFARIRSGSNHATCRMTLVK